MLLSFYLPWLLFAIAQGIVLPTLPLYAADFNISYGLVGFVLAGDALGTLIGDVPAGLLLRKLGTKNVMLLGLVVIMLSSMALYIAGSIYVVLVLRLITGFGIALYTVAQHTYLASQIEATRRGRAIASFGGTMRIGSFLGPAIGGVVASNLGLRSPFLLYGVLCFVSIIIIIRLLHITAKHEYNEGESAFGSLWSTVKDHHRILSVAGTAQLFAQMIRAGRKIIIPLYAADVLGLDVAAIGIILSLSSAIDMLMFYPAGMIMDGRGRKWAIVPCFTLQAIGMFMVSLTTSFWGLLAVTMLIGFGNGLGSGTMMTLGSDLAPSGARGEFLGTWRLIGDMGFTGGPVIVGGVADILALPLAAVTMAGAGLVASGIFAFLVPETLESRKQKRKQ